MEQSAQIGRRALIHEESCGRVAGLMPPDESLYELADFFKVFGDSTRIKILYALCASEMCVQDLTDMLNMTQSAISHQLRILKQAGLVKYRKDGKFVFYALADDHVTQIIMQGMEHVSEPRYTIGRRDAEEADTLPLPSPQGAQR
ncbi:regulatory protein ArsR [Candidatus Moduliflexus flocculans]|uniref:Regulatory protein ArsR n=1 Tax=Candidatus Moduliflexus flocculans TaxID=1499966 RepID=A0A0S6VR74_9BACT|nr:regulatory protein ArsR [Candidatus Moduliflexus flocculans]